MNSKTLLLAALCSLPAVAADIYVPAGADLQSALNRAHGGDTVTLAAGAIYVGHFYLAANSGSQTITIQSSAMNSLPAAGSRVSNTNSSAMPKLISPDGNAALAIGSGANYY